MSKLQKSSNIEYTCGASLSPLRYHLKQAGCTMLCKEAAGQPGRVLLGNGSEQARDPVILRVFCRDPRRGVAKREHDSVLFAEESRPILP